MIMFLSQPGARIVELSHPIGIKNILCQSMSILNFGVTRDADASMSLHFLCLQGKDHVLVTLCILIRRLELVRILSEMCKYF